MACNSSTTTDHEAGRILERGKAGGGFHRGKKLLSGLLDTSGRKQFKLVSTKWNLLAYVIKEPGEGLTLFWSRSFNNALRTLFPSLSSALVFVGFILKFSLVTFTGFRHTPSHAQVQWWKAHASLVAVSSKSVLHLWTAPVIFKLEVSLTLELRQIGAVSGQTVDKTLQQSSC